MGVGGEGENVVKRGGKKGIRSNKRGGGGGGAVTVKKPNHFC